MEQNLFLLTTSLPKKNDRYLYGFTRWPSFFTKTLVYFGATLRSPLNPPVFSLV